MISQWYHFSFWCDITCDITLIPHLSATCCHMKPTITTSLPLPIVQIKLKSFFYARWLVAAHGNWEHTPTVIANSDILHIGSHITDTPQSHHKAFRWTGLDTRSSRSRTWIAARHGITWAWIAARQCLALACNATRPSIPDAWIRYQVEQSSNLEYSQDRLSLSLNCITAQHSLSLDSDQAKHNLSLD